MSSSRHAVYACSMQRPVRPDPAPAPAPAPAPPAADDAREPSRPRKDTSSVAPPTPNRASSACTRGAVAAAALDGASGAIVAVDAA